MPGNGNYMTLNMANAISVSVIGLDRTINVANTIWEHYGIMALALNNFFDESTDRTKIENRYLEL